MYIRYDAASIVLMSNGLYLMGVSASTEGGDLSSFDILFYTSPDLETWTYISIIEAIPTTVACLCPSLSVRDSGEIYCMILNTTSSNTNRLISMRSSDDGETWGNLAVVRENVGEYMAPISDRLFKTDTGRWIYPFCVNTNGQLGSQNGHYTGYGMYSDDEGANWTTSASTLTSPDNLCVEGGIFKKDGSTIVYYFRCRSDVIYSSSSTDEGVTWGTITALGPKAINSTSTVLRLSNGTFIACFNPVPSRSNMQIATSETSATWTNYLLINSNINSHFIEPAIYEKDGYAYVYYSKSLPEEDHWAFCYKKIPLNY